MAYFVDEEEWFTGDPEPYLFEPEYTEEELALMDREREQTHERQQTADCSHWRKNTGKWPLVVQMWLLRKDAEWNWESVLFRVGPGVTISHGRHCLPGRDWTKALCHGGRCVSSNDSFGSSRLFLSPGQSQLEKKTHTKWTQWPVIPRVSANWNHRNMPFIMLPFIISVAYILSISLFSQSEEIGGLPDRPGMGPAGWNLGQRPSQTIAILCGRGYKAKISVGVQCLYWIQRSKRSNGHVGLIIWLNLLNVLGTLHATDICGTIALLLVLEYNATCILSEYVLSATLPQSSGILYNSPSINWTLQF